MKFGIIKSKIDKILLESFSDKEQFKKEMKNFQEYILENKSLTKLFWIYDELKTKRNVDSSIVNDYINESINLYKTIQSKIQTKDLTKLNNWLGNVDVENNYTDIDNLFSESVLDIEEKIKSKKTISESLKKKSITKSEVINLPIGTMVNIANKTINTYINNLNEEDKSKLINFLSSDSKEMEQQYVVIKEEVISKLNKIQKNSDSETSNKIDETIGKISTEKFDKLNLFRLKELNNSI
jgi:hypothetical protein